MGGNLAAAPGTTKVGGSASLVARLDRSGLSVEATEGFLPASRSRNILAAISLDLPLEMSTDPGAANSLNMNRSMSMSSGMSMAWGTCPLLSPRESWLVASEPSSASITTYTNLEKLKATCTTALVPRSSSEPVYLVRRMLKRPEKKIYFVLPNKTVE